ncbi:hypothetical protein GCM10026987_02050 [Belliella aquatica]
MAETSLGRLDDELGRERIGASSKVPSSFEAICCMISVSLKRLVSESFAFKKLNAEYSSVLF